MLCVVVLCAIALAAHAATASTSAKSEPFPPFVTTWNCTAPISRNVANRDSIVWTQQNCSTTTGA